MAAAAGSDPSAQTGPTSTRAPRPPDLGPPTTLLLVRHGRTALTEAHRVSGGGGTLDPDLSAAGEQDAARVAALLDRLGGADSPWPELARPDALLASPMARTRRTAAVVGAALGLQPVVAPAWVEASFGDWDGLTLKEIAARWPDELARWQGSTTAAPPGGESLDAVVARIRTARAATVTDHPGRTVVVVSHVTPIRVVVQEVLDAGPAALWRLAVAPCSVTVVRFWADGPSELLVTNAR